MNISFSQEFAEIILFNGDTIKEQLISRKIKYSKDSIFLHFNPFKRYACPDEITRLKTTDLHLISAKIISRNNDIVAEFIEPLIAGFISLYQSYDSNGKKLFYLQKEDSFIYHIPDKFFKGYILLFFFSIFALSKF